MSRLNNEGVTRASSGILGALKEAENLKVNKVVLSDGAKAVETRKLNESAKVCSKCHKEQCVCKESSLKENVDMDDLTVTIDDAISVGPEDERFDEVIQDICNIVGDDTDFGRIYGIVAEASENGSRAEEVVSMILEKNESAETPEGAEQSVPGEGKEPLQENNSMTNEEKMAKAQELFNIIFDTNSSDEEKENAKKELRVLTGDEALDEEIDELAENDAEEKMVEGLQIVDVKGDTVLLKESKGFIVGKDYDKSTGIIKEAEEYKTEKFAKKAFERLASK